MNSRSLRFKLALLAACWLVAIPAIRAQGPAVRPTAQRAAAPAAGFNLSPATFIPVSQIHPGMRGVAYTVFEGTQPEAMEVEILGVLKNLTGPKGDIILARLHGAKAEYTGVVAGMSGSPVYLDGKLAGALSFRIGMFSREPIAGITPIADMMEIEEFDHTVPELAAATITARNSGASPGTMAPTSLSGERGLGAAPGAGSIQGYAQYLTPIEAPLAFNGFSEEAIKRFAPQFAAAGIVPVMGAGAASEDAQPEPIVPGSAVSAILVRGDMNIAATCTVTYADANRLLACGHPLLQYGMVDMPMTKARVLATLASPYNAFKIVNTTTTVGSFVQDRHTGILGRFGRDAQMIPVTLSIHGPGQAQAAAGPEPGSRAKVLDVQNKLVDPQGKTRTFHFDVLNNPKLTPVAIMATVYSALQGLNQYGEDTTFALQGRIRVQGYPDVAMRDLYAPADNAPTAFAIAMDLGDRFGRIYGNPYQTPDIHGVELDFQAIPERRSARLESARSDVTEARPGEEIVVEAVLRPYRGERIVRSIPVRIPASARPGNLQILVSDGETLNRTRMLSAGLNRRLELGSTIAQLNKEHVNNRLYVSLLQNDPQAMVEDKVMPSLPLSVMNVMNGMLGSQEMVVSGESALDESSSAMDFVVTGSQVVTVLIK